MPCIMALQKKHPESLYGGTAGKKPTHHAVVYAHLSNNVFVVAE